jgi:hypothetical protein
MGKKDSVFKGFNEKLGKDGFKIGLVACLIALGIADRVTDYGNGGIVQGLVKSLAHLSWHSTIDLYNEYFGDEPIPSAIREKFNADLIHELQEEGVGITQITDEMRREMLATGGIDVRNADGTWSRWIVHFNEDGSVRDIEKTGGKPLGTGWFITENSDTTDAKYALNSPNQNPTGTPDGRMRNDAALPPYNETEARLREGGAIPIGESKPSIWDKITPRIIRQPAELPHISLDRPQEYIDAVKHTGGFRDQYGRTWKLWIHPTHGPFWVIDSDGDPRVPKLGEVTSRPGPEYPKTIRSWKL